MSALEVVLAGVDGLRMSPTCEILCDPCPSGAPARAPCRLHPPTPQTCIDSPPSGSDGGHLPGPPPTSGGAGQHPGADDIPDIGASAHGTSHHAPRPEEGPDEGRSPQRLHSLGSGSPPPGQYGVPLVAYQFGR